MNLNEQIGYNGNPNDILKFKNFNPINKGTIDASTHQIANKSKDLKNIIDDIIDSDDDADDEVYNIDDYGGEELVINKPKSIGDHFWSYPYGFKGAPMAIGNTISESLGVSDEIDPWVDLLFSFIRNQIYIYIDKVKSSDDYNTEAELNGNKFESKSLVFNVNGSEFNPYIKKYIPSDNKLKMKDVKIKLGLSSIPDNLFNFDSWYASFRDEIATLKGKTWYGNEFMFEITLPNSLINLIDVDKIDEFLDSNNIYTKILEFLSHELTHAYEFYNRKLNNIDTWKDKFLNTNKYVVENQLLSNVSDDWKYFLRMVYLSLDFEINARITQVYYYLLEKNPKTKYDFISYLKDSDVWREMEELRDFDSEKFIKNFSYKASDEDLREVFISLKIYTEDELSNSDMKSLLLVELIKLWDKNIDQTNKLYSSGEMRKLSPYYINNPSVFFKKFESRFRKKSSDWERKMYRLSSKFDL